MASSLHTTVFTIKKTRDPDACALGSGFAPEDEPGRVGFWVPCWCYHRPFQSVSTLPCLLPSWLVWKWSQQVNAPSTVSPVPCLCNASGFHAPRPEAIGAIRKSTNNRRLVFCHFPAFMAPPGNPILPVRSCPPVGCDTFEIALALDWSVLLQSATFLPQVHSSCFMAQR